MKNKRVILFLGVLASTIVLAFAEPRFYKANSIHIRYQYHFYKNANFREGSVIYETPEYYATMWTANDTIVDDRHCVTLWNQLDDELPTCIGYIYEDENDYVWIKYINAPCPQVCDTQTLNNRGLLGNWMFIYDFSTYPSSGSTYSYYEPSYGVPRKEKVKVKPQEITFLNGEHTMAWREFRMMREFRLYGIGSSAMPFQTEADNYIWQGNYNADGKVIEFWRDGELLFNRDYITGITCINDDLDEDDCMYNLLGHPVEQPEKGIFIQGGKKIFIR